MMGTFLTSYGDAGYDHEGYAAQVLDDGTITGTYGSDTKPRMIGQVVAACGCGWAGTTRYACPEPFDEHAEQLALAEWEHTHAVPTLQRAQHADLTRLQALLGSLAVEVAAPGRPPRDVADQLDRTLRVLDDATTLAGRLRDQARQQAAGAPEGGERR
ncbi:MAG: hypothetical protein ACRDRZ_13145 [Pseudonocardiaceae bacterium]